MNTLYVAIQEMILNGNYLDLFLFVSSITFLIIILKWKEFYPLIKTLLTTIKGEITENKRKKEQVDQLLNHHIIRDTFKWAKFKVNTLENKFNAKFKRLKDFSPTDLDWLKRKYNTQHFLNCKFMAFHIGLNDLSKQFGKHYLDNNQEEIDKILDYNFWQKYLDLAVESYTDMAIGMGLNKEFIELFNTKHEESVHNVLIQIEKTLDNAFYSDSIEIYYAILNCFYGPLLDTLDSIHEILKLNGQLSDNLKDWEIPK